MTPFQRQVLVEEFARQNEEEMEQLPDEAKQNSGRNSGPRTVSGGTRNSRHESKNSKTEAIKESQEEQEKFVNSSVVDNS